MMMDEECIQLMKEHGTTLVPTIIAAERIIVKGAKLAPLIGPIRRAKQVYARAKWASSAVME